MARDPVCGLYVDERVARDQREYQGKLHFFCSQACKGKFERDLARLAGEQTAARALRQQKAAS